MSRHAPPLSHQATKLVSNYLDKSRTRGSETIERRIGDATRFAEFVDKTYHLEHIENLKPGHIESFIKDMQERGLSNSTAANYMTTIRIIANQIGKQNIVERENSAYGISRAGERLNPITANAEKISELREQLYERGEWLGLAHDLRQEFGLRAAESIQWHGDVITHPDGSQSLHIDRKDGSKGGRPRDIPIRTEQQKELINKVQNYIRSNGQRSLMPKNLSRQQAYNVQKNTIHSLGATRESAANMHALRHAYAQDRAQATDRQTVAEELGHGRSDVVSHYVSR
ncbi:MAG: tyrosine-type recombinase/integrase [Dissulfuribacterales bacterium]